MPVEQEPPSLPSTRTVRRVRCSLPLRAAATSVHLELLSCKLASRLRETPDSLPPSSGPHRSSSIVIMTQLLQGPCVSKQPVVCPFVTGSFHGHDELRVPLCHLGCRDFRPFFLRLSAAIPLHGWTRFSCLFIRRWTRGVASHFSYCEPPAMNTGFQVAV